MEIAIAIVSSAALFSFIEFVVRRHDEKKGVLAEIQNKIAEICDKIEESKATDARRRILNASDEIQNYKTKHSKEWFQQLLQDIDNYERYCDDHPTYKNSKAVLAIDILKEVYAKCLKENSFL